MLCSSVSRARASDRPSYDGQPDVTRVFFISILTVNGELAGCVYTARRQPVHTSDASDVDDSPRSALSHPW